MPAKVTKASADYRKATSSRTCGNCSSMRSDGSCMKVQGQVQRSYVCNLWSAMRRRSR